MQEITSLQNPRIQMLRGLKERKNREAGHSFLVEGEKMVREALREARVLALVVSAGVPPARYQTLIDWACPRQAECLLVPERLFAAISGSKSPQGILAQVEIPSMAMRPGLTLALDAVQDPGNVGTILRTADAAGWQGILLGGGCADAYGPKAVQASMGSVFRMPLLQDVDLAIRLARCREDGCAIAVAALEGENVYQSTLPRGNVVLVIGNESAGVSPELLALSTHRLRLPMRGGAESLNAAVAAGIFMYEWTREEED